MTPVLYVITCGNSSAPRVYELIESAQARGWDVCSILTPGGRKFVDSERLEDLTKHPVRSEYKHPDEPDVLPAADAILAFPATFNTVNKCAMGISDTLAESIYETNPQAIIYVQIYPKEHDRTPTA